MTTTLKPEAAWVHAQGERWPDVPDRVKAKDFDESLHPRDEHGRFTSGGDVSQPAPHVDLPDTTEELKQAWTDGIEAYHEAIERMGGRPMEDQPSAESQYRVMEVAEARPEDVTEDERARCEQAAAAWLDDDRNLDLMSAYGRPEIVVASRLIGEDGGADPMDYWCAGQWSNGTIVLYGNVSGNPDAPETPGFTIGGNDPDTTLTHEYGHQVMGVLAFDENGEITPWLTDWATAMAGGRDWTSQTSSQMRENAGQISTYAAKGGLNECFAECFTLLGQPDFDIEDYHGGARDALIMMRERIDADIQRAQGTIPGQGELF